MRGWVMIVFSENHLTLLTTYTLYPIYLCMQSCFQVEHLNW